MLKTPTHRYLAGIVPTSSGYATIRIRPLVSRRTRAAVVSATDLAHVAAGTQLLSFSVIVADAVQAAEVHVPLLGLGAHEVTVCLDGKKLTWDGGAGVIAGDNSMVLGLSTGAFAFVVEAR